MIFHKDFAINGTDNKVEFDAGLESTEKDKKRLLSILIQVDAYQGNYVEGWIEKVRVFQINDKLLDTAELTTSSNNQPKSAQRINEIPVNVELEAGEIFKMALNCGATHNHIIGAYVYETIA